MVKSFFGGGLCLFLGLLVFLRVAQAGAAITPLEQVRTTVTGIIGVMQNKELSRPDKKAVRREKIMAYVTARFDFEEMSRQTLAAKWRELSPEQRKDFERLFSELLRDTYIGRVEAYSDEEIKFVKEVYDSAQPTKAMVYTKVVKNNQEIPINYKLLIRNGEWFVYDVMIEGVSLIRNYRTEFTRILNQEQYAGLVKRLQVKIDNRESANN
jgi:phospholipid transport system substrate-binding protein